MKTKITKALAVLAAAIGFTTAATAATDENGMTPTHWYKFNGNLNSDGSSALTIDGENGDSYVASVDGQAYKIADGKHPHGSSIARGSSDFSVVAVAKTANLSSGVIWSQGTSGTWRGFALVAVDDNKVALRKWGQTWGGDGVLFTATVADATTKYHVYTITFSKTGNKFSLFVDNATVAAGEGTVTDSADGTTFPDDHFQFGSINGGAGHGMVKGIGVEIDDFRPYQKVLSTDEIAKICKTFVRPSVAPVAVWSDFRESMTQGDYTLEATGCTVDEATGALTIGTGGLRLQLAAGNTIYDNRKLTVVVDCDAVPYSGSDYHGIVDIGVNNSYHVNVESAGTTAYQTWSTGTSHTRSYGNRSWKPWQRQTFAVGYSGTGDSNKGATTYTNGVQLIDNTSIVSTKTGIPNIYIGNYNNGSNVATGMRIYGIRLYADKLSAADVAADNCYYKVAYVAPDYFATVSSDTTLEGLTWYDYATGAAVSGMPATYNRLELRGAGTVTSTSAYNKGLNIGGGVTFQPASFGTSTSVSGGGTVVYSALPGGEKTCYQNVDSWRGTVWLKGVSFSGADLRGCGNGNSRVKMSGCSGYLNSSNASLDHAFTLVLENDSYQYGFNVQNGWSGQYMGFAGLEGSGTLKMTKPSGAPTIQYIFKDASKFTGSIDNSVANGVMSVVLNAGDDFTADYSRYQGMILALGTTTVASGKTWNTRSGTVVNGTVIVNGTLSGSVSGNGTIMFNGTGAVESPGANSGLADSTKWTGTVCFNNYTSDKERSPSKYGNQSSTVKFTNVKGWMTTAMTFNGTFELEDDNSGNPACNISNGSSGWAEGRQVTLSHLTGTGTLKASWGSTYPLLLKDVGDFHGSINMSNASGIGALIGPNVTYATKSSATGQIVLDAGASATIDSGKSWTAASGIFVNGTIGGAGTLASNTTFGDGAEIVVTNGMLTANGTVTFGTTTKVRVAAEPTAQNPLVKVLNKSNAGQSVFGTTVALYVGDAAEPTAGNFKLVCNNDGIYVAHVHNFEKEITASTNWSAIDWGGTAWSAYDTYALTVTGEGVVLTFDSIVNNPAALTINGNVKIAMADALYTNGCWEKAFATFGAGLAAANATFAPVKDGFYGAYSQAANGFKLRAQNREVISINIAGGAISAGGTHAPTDSPTTNLVPEDDNFYGLAPTPGRTWNNINGMWKNKRSTVTLKGSKAYDGSAQQSRPTIDLSAEATTTWDAGLDNYFLRGYLDDGGGVDVCVHGVPYTSYDIIVYVTSDGSTYPNLNPVKIGNKYYTYQDGQTVEGASDSVWGTYLQNTPVFGKNALYISGLSGEELTIHMDDKNDTKKSRGTVCAVQVICQGEIVIQSKYFGEMTGDVNWNNGASANLTQLGDAWANGQLSTLTLTNTTAAALSFATATTGMTFKVVSEDGDKLTIPYASLENLSFAQLDFSEAAGKVEIDLTGVVGVEKTLLSGALSGADNVTFTGSTTWGVYADATGIHMLQRTADAIRKNPVTGADETFVYKYALAGTDGDWNKPANWRKAESDGFWKAATVVPGNNNGYEPLFIDGAEVTMNSALNGWNIRYAFFGGAQVMISSIGKSQKGTIPEQYIWVDKDSSVSIGAINAEGGHRELINLYNAAPEGIVLPACTEAYSFNYYLTNSATVKFAGVVTAGTHTLKRIGVSVGDTSKVAKHVGKQLLISLVSGSTGTFTPAGDIVATCDTVGVTPVYQATMPTAADEYGTYTIGKEEDGVYAYVVEHSDTWDIVEPLTATLDSDKNISQVTSWTDGLGHVQTGAVSADHQYKFVGAHVLTIDQVMFENFNVTLEQTTLATGDYVLTNATIAGSGAVNGTVRGGTFAPTADGLTVNATLADNRNVTVNGAGKVTLDSDNTGYTGTITVSAGTFTLGADGNIGAGTVSTATGAFFELGDGRGVSHISGAGTVRKVGSGETVIAAGVINKNSKPAGIVVTDGTLRLGTANTLFFAGGTENVALPLTVTGGTLDLANAFTFSTSDGSGWLGNQTITLGGATATAVVGGSITPFQDNGNDVVMVRYVGNDGQNAPATFGANVYSSYQTANRPREINVEAGAGSTTGDSYDLNFTGVLGTHSGNYLTAFKLKKTGAGVLRVSNTNNFPNTTVDAGTYQLGCLEAMPANLVVNADGTLDLNGFSLTNRSFTCAGTITNTSNRVTEIVSTGTTVDLTGAEIANGIVLKARWADAVAGTQPFVLSDYSKVTFEGDKPAYLEYDTATGKYKFADGYSLGDDLLWLPIGDSITEGEVDMGKASGTGSSESRGGYRYQLWNDLEQGGQQTRSVGYRTGHSGTVEDPAEKRWAWHAAQYGGVIMHDNGSHGATGMNVENILEVAGYPDIATVLIAVNDLSFTGKTQAEYEKVFESWKRMVVKYAEQRPNTKIVVSTLLPAGNSRMNYIAPFNELVRNAYDADPKAAPFDQPNVVFADIARIAFNDVVMAQYYKTSDVLHPNEEGAKIIGKAWTYALQPVVAGLAQAKAVPVSIHNGVGDKVSVRFSKKIKEITAATLTITGTDVDGNGQEWTFDTPVLSATDARVVEFAVGDKTLIGGTYTATLTGVTATDGNDIALDAAPAMTGANVEILGTGGAANVPAAYRQNFTKLQTVEIENGTITDGIGAGVNYAGNGPSAAWTMLPSDKITRVGYYVELQRTNEPAQFVWVSMNADAFNFTTNAIGVPTAARGNVKSHVSHLQVYGNRGNFTNTEADDATQTGVVEFSPWTATGNDQNNYPAEFKSNKFGWNDTLGGNATSLKGCMQVARATGVTPTDDYTQLAGEMIFAFNNFNCDTATDIGIGTFSTHRNNAGGSEIAPVIDWTDFASSTKYTKFAVNAYKVKKIEIWAAPLTEYAATMTENKALSQLEWTPAGGGTAVPSANLPSGSKLSLDVSGNVTLTVDAAFDVSELIVTNSTGAASFTIATTYAGTPFIGRYGVAPTLDSFETDLPWAQDHTIPAGKALVLNVKEGADYTIPNTLSGAGRLVKKGAGVLTLASSNHYSGGTVIEGGSVKYGYGNGDDDGALGPFANNTTTWTTNIVVRSGASLDINGYKDATYVVELQGGSTFKNSSSTSIGDSSRQTKRISLSGDATVDAVGSFGLHNGGHAQSVLDLGTYTLTKTGSGIFDLVNTTVNGAGTIAVNAGTIRVGVSGNVTATDATVNVGASGALQVDGSRTLTIGKLTNAGTISNSGTIAGLTTLNGTIDTTAGGTWTFGSAVTVESGTTTLNATSATALNNKSLTLAGGTLAVGADATIICPITATAASAIAVPEGKVLTVAGAITGGGNVTKTGAGALVLDGGLTMRAFPVLAVSEGSLSYKITEKPEEFGYGSFSVSGMAAGATLTVMRADGTTLVETVPEGGTVTHVQDPIAHGAACYYDFTFTNTIKTAGGSRETYTLQTEKTMEYNAAGDALLLYCSPWNQMNEKMYNLSRFSVAMYGKVSATPNTFFISFGSGASDPKGMLFLATNEDGTKVNVVYYDGTLRTLSQITVPNMTTASHMYVFSKTGDNQLKIYLDGKLWTTVNADFDFVMGSASHSGVQFGSGFGSRPSPYDRVPETDKTADVGTMRIFDYVISDAQMQALKTDFPYTSPSTYARSITTDAADWVASGTWTMGGETYERPAASGVAKVTAEAATTVSVNLGTADAVNYESVELTGTSPITFALAEDNTIPVKMQQAEIDTTVTAKPTAADFSGAVMTFTANGKLVVDLSDLDCRQYSAVTPIEITGTCTDETLIENEKIAIVKPAEMYGRDLRLVYQANQTYAVEVFLAANVESMYWIASNTEMTKATQLADANGVAKYVWWSTMPITVKEDAILASVAQDCVAAVFGVNGGVALDVGTVRGVNVGGSGTVTVQLTEDEDVYGTTTGALFVKAAESTATIGAVRDSAGTLIEDPTRYSVVDGNKVKLNVKPTVFTVVSITPVAQTNFNGSVVVATYSAYEKGDYGMTEFKLKIGDYENAQGVLDVANHTVTFYVPGNVAAASNIYNAVVTVVGKMADQEQHPIVQDKQTSVAYTNTVYCYQGLTNGVAFATNGWFSTHAEGTAVVADPQGAWGTAHPPAAANSKILIDEDEDGVYGDFVFTPGVAAERGQVTVVDMDISFGAALESVAGFAGAQAAICVVADAEDESVYRFAAVADGAWTTNTTVQAEVGTSYPIRLTLDYRNVPSRVTYEVKTGDAYATIASGVSGTTKSAVESVTFNGTGKLAVMTGSNVVDAVDASLVEAEGVKYANIGDALAHSVTNLTLLWNTAWQPTSGAGAFRIAKGGYNWYYTPEEGLLVRENPDGSLSIVMDYWEVAYLLFDANSVTTNKFMYFTNAVVSGGTAVTNLYLLRDVELGETLTVARDIWLNGETNILSGAGLAFRDDATFTIEGGCIGIAPAAGIVLKGGRFTEASTNDWNAYLPSGYVWTKLAAAVRPGYEYQPIPSAIAPTKAAEAVLPVKDANGESVSVVVNTNWTKQVTGGEPDPAKQAAVLSVKQANGLTRLDNEILGLATAGEVPPGNIPVITPHQSSKEDVVTFSLGNVNFQSVTNSGARVKYRVYKSDKPGGKTGAPVEQKDADKTVEMPLPSSGVQYYIIEVDTGAVK